MVGYSRENASYCACGQAHQSGFYREELFQHANGKYVAFLRGHFALLVPSAVSFARSILYAHRRVSSLSLSLAFSRRISFRVATKSLPQKKRTPTCRRDFEILSSKQAQDNTRALLFHSTASVQLANISRTAFKKYFQIVHFRQCKPLFIVVCAVCQSARATERKKGAELWH